MAVTASRWRLPANLATRVYSAAGPKTLAALRITAGLVTFRFVWRAASFVVPPEALWSFPPGTAWLSFLPVSDGMLRAVVTLGGMAAVALTLGWHARWAAWIAAGAVFYVGWVPTLTGKVDHPHHILWVLLILAVSPCANTWALRHEDRPGSFSWPLTAVAVLIALIYFGAGTQKLMSAGLAWGWSDNLVNTILNMGWEKNQSAGMWLVNRPLIARSLGLGALVFELVFPVLLVWPRTRWVWPAGLLFHAGVWLVLGISFLSLALLYVVFLPLDRISDLSPHEPTAGQWRLIVTLVAAVAVFSLSGLERAWPIAAYPGFRGIQDHYIVDVEADGQPVTRMPQSASVGAQRILPLVYSAVIRGRGAELASWLEADRLDLVTIDTRSGEVVDREIFYPTP